MNGAPFHRAAAPLNGEITIECQAEKAAAIRAAYEAQVTERLQFLLNSCMMCTHGRGVLNVVHLYNGAPFNGAAAEQAVRERAAAIRAAYEAQVAQSAWPLIWHPALSKHNAMSICF